MPTIAMKPEPDVWDRGEVEFALANGHKMFQVDGPLTVETAYPSAYDDSKHVVIMGGGHGDHEAQIRVAVSMEQRDRYFPNGATWRMVLIAEEHDGE